MVSVLVVEDDESNLELVAALLEHNGHEVISARSAEEAAAMLRHRRPSVVLVDIGLPGQDGLALTRQIKADRATAAIPVVALTAYAREEDRESALAAGCAAWLTKPLDTRLLIRTLSDLVG